MCVRSVFLGLSDSVWRPVASAVSVVMWLVISRRDTTSGAFSVPALPAAARAL